jgi:hypothetical protein
MGFDRKYGQVTTEHGDIPPDEPVIVFRARDKMLPKLLAYYRLFCWKAGSPNRHLDLIDGSLEQVEQWQKDNPDKIKVPDSERSREWMGN